MPKAYLTIDDGPSEKFIELVDFLADHDIPAVFFNRGDFMEQRPGAVIHAINKGYVIANHAWSHRRASLLSYEENCDEILRTDAMIEYLYSRAGAPRPAKYFRFPYMDRGMGPFLVEPEDMREEYRAAHEALVYDGLGHALEQCPSNEAIQKKRKIQKYLKLLGYEKLPARLVKIPWYAKTGMHKTIDSLCTYSTGDWTLLDRHKGRHRYKTIEDLEHKIDADPSLQNDHSHHIILAHDQAEIHAVTKALILHFTRRNFEFLDVE